MSGEKKMRMIISIYFIVIFPPPLKLSTMAWSKFVSHNVMWPRLLRKWCGFLLVTVFKPLTMSTRNAKSWPLHTRDWEPMTITLQALTLVEMAELVQVCFTLRLRDQRNRWMQDGRKVYMDSYMAWNGSCFMVTWTFSKNHLLEVSLTQNRETMTLRTLTTGGLFNFIIREPKWIKIHWNSIWLRAWSHTTSYYTWGSVTTPHDFGGVLGRPLDTFFWALTIPWSRLLAHVWSDPQFSWGPLLVTCLQMALNL